MREWLGVEWSRAGSAFLRASSSGCPERDAARGDDDAPAVIVVAKADAWSCNAVRRSRVRRRLRLAQPISKEIDIGRIALLADAGHA